MLASVLFVMLASSLRMMISREPRGLSRSDSSQSLPSGHRTSLREQLAYNTGLEEIFKMKL